MQKVKECFKKIGNITLTVALLLPGMVFPSTLVKADGDDRTLAEVRQDLIKWEEELKENNEKQQLTQAEIDKITGTISANTNSINQLSEDMIKLQEEITKAEKDIEAKDKEIKEILNFLQISSGESAYLEYVFGAKDFTDFIYRMAISEQLSSYNESLVDEYNQLIEDNKNKKLEKEKKQEELRQKQKELETQKGKLGDELKTTTAATPKIEQEIALVKKTIEGAEKQGCKEDETLNACYERQKVLPPGTAFYRPIISGRVTSEFGSRCYWLNGVYKCDLHGGLDMAQSGTVPVYASAPGIVVGHGDRWACGGNIVFIIHNINGKKYTSSYAHLRKITVKDGQVVSTNTQVGIMGGNPATEWWDGCSTGQHVHFTLANGHYLKDYYSWSQFEAHMFNPRILLNVPGYGGRFYDRTTKY